jgi:hypothetical protein
MNVRTIAAGYSVLMGIGIVGFWVVALVGGEVPEVESELTRVLFHVFSEFLMGGVLIAAGIGLLLGRGWGSRAFVLGMGFAIYSVLNAAGYYGQAGNLGAVVMFLVLAAASAGFFMLSGRIELRIAESDGSQAAAS